MNKSELAHRVAQSCDLSEAAGTQAVEAVFDVISEALAAGDKVAIAKFGSFEMKQRAARQGRNPRTGETINIEASRAIGFKPASGLKEKLNA